MAYKPAFHVHSALLDSFFHAYSAIVDSFTAVFLLFKNILHSAGSSLTNKLV